jgi:hypothetical protein
MRRHLPICLVAFSAFTANLMPLLRPGISADVREFLSHISMHDRPDGHGGTVRVVRIEGMDVQIVNGSGQTGSPNGAGNLILGYNEPPWLEPTDRDGSHSLVVGDGHNWSGDSHIVSGMGNRVDGLGAVAFGASNYARSASVLGGTNNDCEGSSSSILGGNSNRVQSNNLMATISGGHGNVAWGLYSSVSGGNLRSASQQYDWVAGSLLEDY